MLVQKNVFKEILQGSSLVFLVKIIGAGLNYVLNVIIARSFSQDDSGVFFLAYNIIFVAAAIGRFGLDNAVLKLVSVCFGNNEWRKISDLIKKSVIICICFSLLISILLYLCVLKINYGVFSDAKTKNIVTMMIFGITPFSLYWIIGEVFRAVGKNFSSQILQSVLYPLLMCLLIFLNGVNVIEKLSLYFVLDVWIVLFVGCVLICKLIKFEKQNLFSYAAILKSGYSLLCLQVVILLVEWSPSFLLGLLGTKSDLSVFNVSLRTAMLTSFILVAVNNVVAPKYAALYASGQMERLQEVVYKTSKLMMVVAIPVLCCFIVFSKEVMFVFGESYIKYNNVLVILCCGQLFNVLSGSVGYLLVVTGYEKLFRNIVLISGIMVFVLNCFLIKFHGVTGASISYLFGQVVTNVSLIIIIRNKLKIKMIPYIG